MARQIDKKYRGRLNKGAKATVDPEELARAGYGLRLPKKKKDAIIDMVQSGDFVVEDGKLTFGRAELYPTGMVLPDDTTQDEWLEIGETLLQLGKAWQFWVGDWVNAQRTSWGEMYTEAVERFGYDHGTIANWAWVCREVPVEIRRAEKDFSHHQVTASLPHNFPLSRRDFLEMAVERNMSVRELRTFAQEVQALPASYPMSRKQLVKELISRDLRSAEEIRAFVEKDLLPAGNTSTAAESLFDKRAIPKITTTHRRLYNRALSGDPDAAQQLRNEMEQIREWIEQVEEDLQRVSSK